MAYLPFYITPEEFCVYQEKKEREILLGKNHQSWTKNDVEEPERFARIFIFLLIAMPVIGLFTLIMMKDLSVFSVVFGGISEALVLYGAYWLVALDERYDYFFSEKGLVHKKQRAEPKWVNVAVQMIAWVGVFVFIYAISILGLAALSGVGALILLSFWMLKRRPDPKVDVMVSVRDDWLFVHYNKKRKVIVLYLRYDICEYCDLENSLVNRNQTRGRCYIFCSSIEHLEKIINILMNTFQLECTEILKKRTLFDLKDYSDLVCDIPVLGERYLAQKATEFRVNKNALPEPVFLCTREL